MKAEFVSALVDEEVFRAATLRQVVELARRRRRARRVRPIIALGCVLLAIGLLFRPSFRDPFPVAVQAAPHSIVTRTTPFPAGQRIRSTAAGLTVVKSSASEVALVGTQGDLFVAVETSATTPKVRVISDRQLIASFPEPHPALIAPGTAEARLVFY